MSEEEHAVGGMELTSQVIHTLEVFLTSVLTHIRELELTGICLPSALKEEGVLMYRRSLARSSTSSFIVCFDSPQPNWKFHCFEGRRVVRRYYVLSDALW